MIPQVLSNFETFMLFNPLIQLEPYLHKVLGLINKISKLNGPLSKIFINWINKQIKYAWKILGCYNMEFQIYNISEQRIQLWSISLATRLSGSGSRADVKLFQIWNANESSRIFWNRTSWSALSASVAGRVKYLFEKHKYQAHIKGKRYKLYQQP